MFHMSVASFKTCSVFHLKNVHDIIKVFTWHCVSPYCLLYMSVIIAVSVSLLADAQIIYKRLLIGAQKLVQSRGFYQISGNEM